jgi:two-component system phosphate regulon sensor histidine kinase PhoR
MHLPLWLCVLLITGFLFGIFASIKNFTSNSKKMWPENKPQKREAKDQDEQTRRDFVANVSHELRTPVSIIKGFADSLQEDYEILSENKRKSFLSKIQKNAERLNSLVEDLLVLAKLEKPKTTLSKEPLDLCELVREIKEEFLQRKESCLPKLILLCPAVPVRILADPQKLVSVFENLIDNAIIHAGGLSQISIRISENLEDNSITSEVEDDGKGIEQEDQEMLFERFYRVDKGRSRNRGGTGLGLSITREIIDAHDGEISVRSKVDSGTVFSFKIPKSL